MRETTEDSGAEVGYISAENLYCDWTQIRLCEETPPPSILSYIHIYIHIYTVTSTFTLTVRDEQTNSMSVL